MVKDNTELQTNIFHAVSLDFVSTIFSAHEVDFSSHVNVESDQLGIKPLKVSITH